MTKQIQVGDWDNPGRTIEVEDNTTLGQALEMAGIQMQAQERVASMNSNSLISMNDIVQNGEQYIVTQNHVSGSY